ncbi:MAG: hypothetical protein IKI85_02245, partial [Bacteroidales bacterium]|nr:hypothetical protein [Bacteroidales bacterium]
MIQHFWMRILPRFCSSPRAGAFLDAHFEAFLLFSTCWSISGCAFCRDFALLHVLEHFWMRILRPFCSSPRAGAFLDAHFAAILLFST